jgi:hypothetical protein
MSTKSVSDFNLDNYKFHFSSQGYVDCFVENGFFVAEEVFDQGLIAEIYNFISTKYMGYKASLISKFPERGLPVLGMGKHIMSELKSEGLFEKLISSRHFLDALEKLIGPDLTMPNTPSLWINDKDDPSIATNKSLHQEIWSGIGVDDITVWIPYHETDTNTTMLVIPRSHYFGFFPNQNRKILCPDGFKMPDSLSLAPLKPGCAVFFHSLLLHATSGRGENIRYATSFPVKNTLSPSTRQQQTFGCIPLRNGPLSKIRTVLGNDYLSPLRTFGGQVSNNQNFHPSELE